MTAKALAGFIAGSVLSFGFAGPSQAVPITWEFEGTVRSFTATNPNAAALAGSLGIEIDAPVSGRMTYESTTPDADPPRGTYIGAVVGFDVTIGSYSTSLDPTRGSIFGVRLLRPQFPLDLEFAEGNGVPDALFPLGSVMALGLLADVAGVIPDAWLPLAPPPLSALRPFSIEDWDEIG